MSKIKETLKALDGLAHLLEEFKSSLTWDIKEMAEALEMGVEGPIRETGHTLWKLKEAFSELEIASEKEGIKVIWTTDDEYLRRFQEIPENIRKTLEMDFFPIKGIASEETYIANIVNAYAAMKELEKEARNEKDYYDQYLKSLMNDDTSLED